MFNRILIPVDPSAPELVQTVAPVAMDIAKYGLSRIHLLSIIPPPDIIIAGTVAVACACEISTRFSETDLRKILTTSAESFEFMQDHVIKHIDSGIPADVIIRQAKDTNADLIIIGAQKRKRGIFPWSQSTALSVLHRSRVPVLIIQS